MLLERRTGLGGWLFSCDSLVESPLFCLDISSFHFSLARGSWENEVLPPTTGKLSRNSSSCNQSIPLVPLSPCSSSELQKSESSSDSGVFFSAICHFFNWTPS
uniref:Uncharacterized protein n=1 Tax=Arundo donax TaxID=35708 RepID=A0A0A9D2E6_ARUDO